MFLKARYRRSRENASSVIVEWKQTFTVPSQEQCERHKTNHEIRPFLPNDTIQGAIRDTVARQSLGRPEIPLGIRQRSCTEWARDSTLTPVDMALWGPDLLHGGGEGARKGPGYGGHHDQPLPAIIVWIPPTVCLARGKVTFHYTTIRSLPKLGVASTGK